MKFFLIVIHFLCFTACTFEQIVKKGDAVLLQLKITNKSGKIIDESGYFKQDMPLLIVVGNKEVFNTIDNALLGMKLNEEKNVTISPDLAYGQEGVFYLGNKNDTIYVIEPNDTLFAQFKIVKIGNRH